jgi:DinB superfamily
MSECVFCKKQHDFDREEAYHILRRSSDTLRLILDDSDPATFAKQESDLWSPRQILIHMVDTEYAYGFRFRYIMAEADPVITPYNQNDWVGTFHYGDLDATQLVRAFTPIRRVNLELLQNVDPKLFDKQARHPEYGMITVGMMVPHLAAHDLKHLQQIRDRLPVS